MPASTLRCTTTPPSASLFFVMGSRRPACALASVPKTPTILPSNPLPPTPSASRLVPPRLPLLYQSSKVPDVQPRERQPLEVEKDVPQLTRGRDQVGLHLQGVRVYR